MSIPGRSFAMKRESLFWRLCFFKKKKRERLQLTNKQTKKNSHLRGDGPFIFCVYLSPAAVWVPCHFGSEGHGQLETSMLMTPEPVSTPEHSCCVRYLPLLSWLPNVYPGHKGPMLDSVFGSRPTLQNSYSKYTHTHPDIQILLRHQQAHL